MRDYSSWGMYIGHFVFLVAVSLVGSLVTAILKLLDIKWAAPITRISEIIAVAAVMLAAVTIIVDMGRPDRVLNIFMHGRIQSPIVWDMTVVNLYLLISIILLYLPMIPDIAIMRDTLTDRPKWQRKMYHVLPLNWKGTPEQWKLLKRSIWIMCIVIMPVAFAIHTVTSWLFAVNSRAGWDSTIFGPYFVSGAFMVGAAAVIAAMYIFIKARPDYKKYITAKQFDMMGKLLVLTGLVYLYFNINEYLVPGYKMQELDGKHLMDLFVGHEAPTVLGNSDIRADLANLPADLQAIQEAIADVHHLPPGDLLCLDEADADRNTNPVHSHIPDSECTGELDTLHPNLL